MGEIILSQAGRVAGQALLPNGLNILGTDLSGAALGGLAGSVLGRSIDRALAPDINGPRLSTLRVMESREGAGIARIYGRGRTGGQLIWASRFREQRWQGEAGKGGPTVNHYSYSASFAVAIAEGPISRIGTVWANGEILPLDTYTWRLYKGDEDQLPDPLIEAVEGEGAVPAYRGIAYIVFEDLPLDAFGNRLPQLSFEVIRSDRGAETLGALVKGVNIIPASGEFVYATTIVRDRRFPGIERPLNMNNAAGDADFNASLGQLRDELPAVTHAALTVAWFGDDLRAAHCRIRPGVETRTRETVPYGWSVDGETRQSAKLISQTSGAANYGGTPSDRSVLEAIASMKAAGLAVTLSPFLLMDVPPGNTLPDPYGGASQPAFPWRGRIISAADGTSVARSDIEAFLGEDGGFGYRHFILHHARLAAEAGGVDAFLIGSEMTALTRVRDEAGAFPFVDGLVSLAAEVRFILGPQTRISYAADWTEYGAVLPSDSPGDVLFPLDQLWADDNIDFVAVDWYPPLTDWRDTAAHADLLAGYGSPDDPGYLASGLQGGEAYDWYYATDEDRDAQIRTPIVDTAYQEHWIFRQKDIEAWWSNAHYERFAGVRQASPTSWIPGAKPVWLMEIGFPAVDKGTNAPNLFSDPKSSESGLPPFSRGARDDILQRRALEVALSFWSAKSFVERSYVWAWDGRPWPEFPARKEIWSDGPNWTLGHWLNGRSGLISVAKVAEHIAASAGVALDASALDSLTEGFRLDGPMPLREALEPLHALHGFTCLEAEEGLRLVEPQSEVAVTIAEDLCVEGMAASVYPMLDKRPGRLSMSYIDGTGAYDVAIADARREDGDAALTLHASLPLVLSEPAAASVAANLLATALESETADVALGPSFLAIEPGDRIAVDGLRGDWCVNQVTDSGLERTLSLVRPPRPEKVRASTLPSPLQPVLLAAVPEMIFIDGPSIGEPASSGPLIALAGDPWTGPVPVRAGRSMELMTVRSEVEFPASIGRLRETLRAGPTARWDRVNTMKVELEGASLSSTTELAVLAGANRLLVQGEEGWELLSFRDADLLEAGVWRLSALLRGQGGSLAARANEGALCVLVNEALASTVVRADEVGAELIWQAGTGSLEGRLYQDVANRPWRVAHLRVSASATGGGDLSWLPAGPPYSDSWDLPDPLAGPAYQVEALLGGEAVFTSVQTEPSLHLEEAGATIRVAQLSADGRRGPWVSIETAAP